MAEKQSKFKPQTSYIERSNPNHEILERFRNTPIKIAFQKDGELTDISREIFSKKLGITIPERNPRDRRLVNVSPDGTFGFIHTRNKDLCELVASGAADVAIVGSDRVVESKVTDKIVTIARYEDVAAWQWPIVIATANHSGINDLEQIRRVATQYPEITGAFFKDIGLNVDIIQSSGGTEIYPHIDHNGSSIDAIVDLTATGVSLEANGLTKWDPPIFTVSPVMIVNADSYRENLNLFTEVSR